MRLLANSLEPLPMFKNIFHCYINVRSQFRSNIQPQQPTIPSLSPTFVGNATVTWLCLVSLYWTLSGGATWGLGGPGLLFKSVP